MPTSNDSKFVDVICTIFYLCASIIFLIFSISYFESMILIMNKIIFTVNLLSLKRIRGNTLKVSQKVIGQVYIPRPPSGLLGLSDLLIIKLRFNKLIKYTN